MREVACLRQTEEGRGRNRFLPVHPILLNSLVPGAKPTESWGALCSDPEDISFLLGGHGGCREHRGGRARPRISPGFHLAALCVGTQGTEGQEDRAGKATGQGNAPEPDTWEKAHRERRREAPRLL